MRFLLLVQAYWKLIVFDRCVRKRNFQDLYGRVRSHPLRGKPAPLPSVEDVCRAVDLACIWFWRQAMCLERSAATACLLRQYGIPAQLVIGGQQMPFRAHAWVEVGGAIVNDKPYLREMYTVLDQC